MRPKSLILLALALGCGLVAAIGINQVLARKPEVVVQTLETSRVLVATTDIGAGEVIQETSVKLEPWPKEKLPDDAITDPAEVAGKTAAGTIFKGEPIRLGRLSDGSAAVNFIPEGYRSIPIRVDSTTGGANMILPHNRVDVLVYLRQNLQQGIKESGVRTILQDVKVFAVNDVFRQEQNGEKSIAAKTISLLVTPEQAQMLALAEELGKLRLVMRNGNDSEPAHAGGADVSDLFGSERGNRDEEAAGEGIVANGNPQEQPSLIDSIKTAMKPTPVVEEPVALQPAPPAPPPPFRMLLIEGAENRVLEFPEGDMLPTESPSSGKAGSAALSGNATRPAFGGVPLSPDMIPADESKNMEEAAPAAEPDPAAESQPAAEAPQLTAPELGNPLEAGNPSDAGDLGLKIFDNTEK